MSYKPPKELYPFESKYLDLGGLRLHYIDEGSGEPVVMVHGNPTWSFMYRELAKALRPTHRIVALDHIGCGLSDKPGDDRYDYTLARRVDDLERLLERLGLNESVTLVLHDWGGMIGMGWAVRHPERVKRIVLMNTAAFRLPADKRLPFALRLTRTRLGAWLTLRLNAFSRGASRTCTVRPLPPAVRRGFEGPYDSVPNRIATLRFVQDIPLSPSDRAWTFLEEVERGLGRLRGVPISIFWGEKDFVFDEPFLREWLRRFPQAELQRFPDAGHYVLEDAGDRIIPRVRELLARRPAGARP